MAEMSCRGGNVPQARSLYQKALAMEPKNLDALLGAARMEDREGRMDVARHAVPARRRRRIRNNPTVLNDLGLCLARQGKLPEAERALARAVQLEPAKPLYRNNIAKVLVEMNRMDAACTHLAAVYPPAVVNYNMGVLLYQRGRDAEAERFLAAALAIDPRMEPARALLAEIAARGAGVPDGAGAHGSGDATAGQIAAATQRLDRRRRPMPPQTIPRRRRRCCRRRSDRADADAAGAMQSRELACRRRTAASSSGVDGETTVGTRLRLSRPWRRWTPSIAATRRSAPRAGPASPAAASRRLPATVGGRVERLARDRRCPRSDRRRLAAARRCMNDAKHDRADQRERSGRPAGPSPRPPRVAESTSCSSMNVAPDFVSTRLVARRSATRSFALRARGLRRDLRVARLHGSSRDRASAADRRETPASPFDPPASES